MSSSRKILHVSARADMGGGPRHILNILDGTRSEYHNFVAAPRQGYFYPLFLERCVKYHPLPHRSFSVIHFFSLLWFIFYLRIDLIHTHGRGAGIYGRLAGLITRTPVVHTHHGFNFDKYSFSSIWFLKTLERILNLLSLKVIFVSQSELLHCMHFACADPKKSIVINNGVNIQAARTNRHSNANSSYKIITVTRLEPEKGNSELLKIVSILKSFDPRFVLDIVGDGPEKATLKELARFLQIEDQVNFLGVRSDVQDILEGYDVFVSASHGEAQGIAIVEAMAASIPVVVSNVRGHSDMIESGKNGLLFKANDFEAGALAILKVLQSKDFSRTLSRNARQDAVDYYSIESMLSNIKNIYSEILNLRK